MHQHAARRIAPVLAVFSLASAVALASAPSRLAAQNAPRQAAAQPAAPKAEKPAPASTKSEQAIVVLVNDEPITAYEIQQRTAFLALNSGGSGQDLKAKAEARWAQITKDPEAQRAPAGSTAGEERQVARGGAGGTKGVRHEAAAEHDRADQAGSPRRHAAEVQEGGTGGADRGAAEAAGGQAAGHRDHRRRGQARHQGPCRAQQDDGGAVHPAASRAPASTSRPCARGSGRNLHGARWSGGGARCWSPSTSATSSK